MLERGEIPQESQPKDWKTNPSKKEPPEVVLNVAIWKARALSPGARSRETSVFLGEHDTKMRALDKKNKEDESLRLTRFFNWLVNFREESFYRLWEDAKKSKDAHSMYREAVSLERALQTLKIELEGFTIDDPRIQKAQKLIDLIHNEIEPTLHPKNQ